jgi:hypothetical protein
LTPLAKGVCWKYRFHVLENTARKNAQNSSEWPSFNIVLSATPANGSDPARGMEHLNLHSLIQTIWSTTNVRVQAPIQTSSIVSSPEEGAVRQEGIPNSRRTSRAQEALMNSSVIPGKDRLTTQTIVLAETNVKTYKEIHPGPTPGVLVFPETAISRTK